MPVRSLHSHSPDDQSITHSFLHSRLIPRNVNPSPSSIHPNTHKSPAHPERPARMRDEWIICRSSQLSEQHAPHASKTHEYHPVHAADE
jgi:hypothetical protein